MTFRGEGRLLLILFLTISLVRYSEGRGDFLKLVFFFFLPPPLFSPFLLFCVFRGPSYSLAKTPCAPPRASPLGRPEGTHRGPFVRPGPLARG